MICVFPSVAGGNILQFPYIFIAWSTLGPKLAILLMKSILNFIAIAQFEEMRITTIMQRRLAVSSTFGSNCIGFSIYFREGPQAKTNHDSRPMKLALNFIAVVLKIMGNMMLMQRCLRFRHVWKQLYWVFLILSLRAASQGQIMTAGR